MTMRSSLTTIAIAAALAAAVPATAQDDPSSAAEPDDTTAPYAGTWDCDVAVLVVTDTTYDPGDGPITITSVDAKDGSYTLHLEGDTSVVLTPGEEDMAWFSPETGDSFDCSRVED